MDHPSQGKTQMFRSGLDDAGFQQVRPQKELPCILELVSQLQDLLVLLQPLPAAATLRSCGLVLLQEGLSKLCLALLMHDSAWGADDISSSGKSPTAW
jgi:hypothetical protein